MGVGVREQSCLTLCNPMNCSLPGYSVHGIVQSRILEWVDIPFSRGSFQPRDQTQISCITARFFTIWATREVQSNPNIPLIVEKFVAYSQNTTQQQKWMNYSYAQHRRIVKTIFWEKRQTQKITYMLIPFKALKLIKANYCLRMHACMEHCQEQQINNC